MHSFQNTLHKATFEKRYKRFFADMILEDGSRVTAHCPNTGSMKSCLLPGSTVWLSRSDDPKRKLQWTWELVETVGGYIGVNTGLPNRVVETGIRNSMIPELFGYSTIAREVKYGTNSRIDLLLSNDTSSYCYVEIKNTTLFENDHVMFPDAVTERGQKHLRDLADVVKQGHRGVIFFLVNRPEGKGFLPADHIDKEYGQLLRDVQKQGVEVLAYRADHTLRGISIGSAVQLSF